VSGLASNFASASILRANAFAKYISLARQAASDFETVKGISDGCLI
jgi:hypothetical protein